MSTTEFALLATTRTEQRKQVNQLRATGQIPGVIYGHGFANQMVKVPTLEFIKVFHKAGYAGLVELSLDDHKPLHVLIAEVQTDYLGAPRHIDFHQVSMNEAITTEVPLRLSGEAPAVYNLGGSLIQTLEEIEVKALPGDLPQAIEIDVTGLDQFDMSMSVADLVVPDKVEVLTDASEMVCKIEAPRSDEEMAALEEEMGEAVGEEAAAEAAEQEEAAAADKEANAGEGGKEK